VFSLSIVAPSLRTQDFLQNQFFYGGLDKFSETKFSLASWVLQIPLPCSATAKCVVAQIIRESPKSKMAVEASVIHVFPVWGK